jgi:hypothetical protein
LFSNMLKLCSSLNVRDQVSHPYKTTGKVIVLCTLILCFQIAARKAKDSELHGSKHSLYLVFS